MSDLSEVSSPDPSFRILADIAVDLSKREITFSTFSNATLKIRQALDDPNVDSNRLARLISSEPLLSMKIVQIANSAGLGGVGGPVSGVHGAIARVGLKTVRTIAISVAMAQIQAASKLGQHAKRGELAWNHSVNVAAIAFVIAQKTGRLSPDDALFAGLVHDIGYFYLLSIVDRYEELSNDAAAFDAILRDWHAPIGQSVLHAFDLSDAMLEAVSEHEAGLCRFPPTTMIDVIALANRVAAETNPIHVGVQSTSESLNDPELMQLLADADTQLRALRTVLMM